MALCTAAQRPTHQDENMMTMTVPQMTSMFLATVVCLGAALVWMFWELQKPAQLRRRSDRFERS
jgi:hypothetical protein